MWVFYGLEGSKHATRGARGHRRWLSLAVCHSGTRRTEKVSKVTFNIWENRPNFVVIGIVKQRIDRTRLSEGIALDTLKIRAGNLWYSIAPSIAKVLLGAQSHKFSVARGRA